MTTQGKFTQNKGKQIIRRLKAEEDFTWEEGEIEKSLSEFEKILRKAKNGNPKRA